jgi:hypothetical protein
VHELVGDVGCVDCDGRGEEEDCSLGCIYLNMSPIFGRKLSLTSRSRHTTYTSWRHKCSV